MPDLTSTTPSRLQSARYHSRGRKARSVDTDKLLEDVFDQVDSIFALTTELGLSSETAREIVKDVVDLIASGYSSRPDPEAVIKKIKRNSKAIAELIATKILSIFEKPAPKQLEFIAIYGGKAVISEANKLYRLSVSYGREDIVTALRHAWNNLGPKGMVSCPKCGFNSILSDRSCLICGAIVSDEYIKSALEFSEKFELYLKVASCAELNEILQLGYVLLSKKGVYSPRSQRALLENPIVYPIYLKRNELSRLVEELATREVSV
ncbi:MAG: hypothetical protein QXV04_04420 [Desulfurococcaceae archaeon]